jgi:hypothetical protein
MVSPFLNPALTILRAQLRVQHPGIIVGWIGDASHSSRESDHNPDPDGSVDAIDPMIGEHYTRLDAQRDVDALVKSRDKRIHYLIWERRIISSVVNAWEWRSYTLSDPHTGHFHLSTLDSREKSMTEWSIYVPNTVPTIEIGGTKPLLCKGMSDVPGGVAHIKRMQAWLGVTEDGDFGPATEESLKHYLGSSYKGVVDMDAWRKILGLW